MVLKKALLAATVTLLSAVSQAATLVDFSFAGNDGTQASETGVVITGITATDLVRGAGMRNNSSATWSTNGFSIRKPSSGTVTTLAQAMSLNVYATFSVTVEQGYTMSLSSLDFGWARQNSFTRNLALLVSVGDDTFVEADLKDTETVTNSAGQTAATGHSFSLSSDPALQSITGTTVYFRIYMYGTQSAFETEALSNGNGQVGLDLIGTISAIPEPSAAAALVGAVALGFVAYRRRRA